MLTTCVKWNINGTEKINRKIFFPQLSQINFTMCQWTYYKIQCCDLKVKFTYCSNEPWRGTSNVRCDVGIKVSWKYFWTCVTSTVNDDKMKASAKFARSSPSGKGGEILLTVKMIVSKRDASIPISARDSREDREFLWGETSGKWATGLDEKWNARGKTGTRTFRDFSCACPLPHVFNACDSLFARTKRRKMADSLARSFIHFSLKRLFLCFKKLSPFNFWEKVA